jgi:hypothetical protein
LFPPEDVPWLLSRIARGQMLGQDRFEFYLPQVAGDHLPVVIAARQLENPDGRLCSIVTLTDITEQKSAETNLRRANVLLEAREHAIDEDLLLAARIQQSLALSWKDLAARGLIWWQIHCAEGRRSVRCASEIAKSEIPVSTRQDVPAETCESFRLKSAKATRSHG